MLFIERLKAEISNTEGHIILYEDGSKFIKALERSAFMFCRNIKPFIPVVKNNKEYGDSYITIGFQKEHLEKYINLDGYKYIREESDKVIVHKLLKEEPVTFPEASFEEWKNKAIAAANDKRTENRTQKTENDNTTLTPQVPLKTGAVETERKLIIADIMQQPLADYTPMRALNYLNSLQERIRNAGISD